MSERIIQLIGLVSDLSGADKSNDYQKTDELLNKIAEVTEELKKESKKRTLENEQESKKEVVSMKQRVASVLDKLKNKIIHKVQGKNKYKLKHVSPSKLQLLKQKIKFNNNTVSMRRMAQNLHIASLNVQNKTLEGMINVKETVKDTKAKIVDKAKLAKKTIKAKMSSNKQYIKRVSQEKINNFKAKINDIKLTVSTQVGARALYASEKLEDKMLFLKDRIQRKVHSKKNVIARKTGMQIALFKDSLKARKMNRLEKKMQKTDDRIEQNKQKIEQLKSQKKELLNQLLGHNGPELVEEGVKTR